LRQRAPAAHGFFARGDPTMSRLLLALAVLVILSASRCQEPRPTASSREPHAGDFVKLRGTLSEDVDCRLLRTDTGKVYSLSARIPTYVNGTRLCVHGTIAEISQCLTLPMIEVTSIRSWSSCP
jgi:hypothetical protein